MKIRKIENTRLYTVLTAMPFADRLRLNAFLKTNYKNAAQENLLLALFASIENGKNISRTDVWVQIHAAEPYNDVKLRLLCSDLLHSVESFLITQSTNALRWERERHLVDYFIKNPNAKLAHFYHNAMLLEKKNSHQHDLIYFYHTLLDNETNLLLQDLSDAPIFDLNQTDIDINKTFVLAKLKNAIRKYWNNLAGTIENEEILLTEILATVPQTAYFYEEPIILLYYHLYQLFIEKNTAIFDRIKTELKDISYLKKAEACDIYLMVENYIALNIQNKVFSYQDLIVFYEQGDAKGMLYTDSGTILSARLQSIINTHIQAKEYEKALVFLNNKRLRIAPAERETTYNLNLGHLYFYVQRYAEVPALVLPITPDFPVLYLTAQRILLKTYYTQQKNDLLDTTLDTYQHYLYATKRVIAPHNREGNLNFVKTLRFIAQAATFKNRPSRLQVLAKAKRIMEKGSFVSDRVWLNDQISAFL